MKILPRARTSDLVVQSLQNEILLYDLNVHKAFHLNETSAAVYQACDGVTTFDELKLRHKFSDDLIFLALDQLREDDLIVAEDMPAARFGAVSRREAVRRIGLSSLMALPIISVLRAPTAAQAQSLAAAICTTGSGITCNTSADCGTQGYCDSGVVTQCQCISNCCVECSFSATAEICAGVCIETLTDNNNCGGCGTVCTGGSTCVAGRCLVSA